MLENELPEVAIATNRLILDPRSWVHRRVETLTFLDEFRVRRHVSVDFTAPAELTYVPLSLVKKKVMKDLDVRDAAGAAVPVLTRSENGVVAAAILVFQAAAILGVNPEAVPEQHRDAFVDIAGITRSVDDEPSAGELKARADRALELLGAASESAVSPVVRERWKLWSDPLMRALAREFAEQFILLVAFPVEKDARRILKVSYEESLRPERAGGENARTFLESLGLRDYVVRFAAPALFDGESYHLQVPTPNDVLVAEGRLQLQTRWADRRKCKPFDVRPLMVERRVERCSLYARAPARSQRGALSEAGKLEEAEVEIAFALHPSLVWPVFLVCAATLSVLVTGLVLRLLGHHHVGDVSPLIVTLPALFAAYLVPGEHRLARRMYRGLRVLLLVSAGLSISAGAILAVDFLSRARLEAWALLTVLALGVTVVAGLSLVRARA